MKYKHRGLRAPMFFKGIGRFWSLANRNPKVRYFFFTALDEEVGPVVV